MASSKVVTTNPDLPRQSSICSLSTLLADLHHNTTTTNDSNDPSKSITMDDLLKSIYSSDPTTTTNPNHPDPSTTISRQGSFSLPKDMAAKTVDEVWKEIVSGTDSHSHSHPQTDAGEPLAEMTLEDFLTKAGAVREDDVSGVPVPTLVPAPGGYHVDPAGINGGAQFPMEGSSVEGFGNGIEGTVVGVAPPAAPGRGGGRGKRRAVEETLDKATLQKQRRMIKNRESAARSRERKQAYTVELESLVTHLEEENARLLREEADKNKQRFKQLMECLVPVVEKRKPRRMLRRVNSVQW